MTVNFGKANYSDKSTTFEKPLFFKLGHKTDADRVLVLRLAPPTKDLADKGEWSRYLKTHFGYTLPFVRKDGTQGTFPATFLCVERTDREGNIRTSCPECEEVKRRKDAVEAGVAKLKKAGKTPEEIDTATIGARKWLKDHNRDGKSHLLAKTLDNKWGILMISYTCMKRLKTAINKLVEKGIDPLSKDKGVWFRFYREGSKFNEIEDYAEVVMEDQPDGSSRIKFDSITTADMQQLEKLPSLSEIGRALDADQIQQIVSSGGSEAVLRMVLSIPVRTQKSETPAAEVDEVSPDPVPETQATVATAAEPPAGAETQDPEVMKLMEALQKAQAAAAAKKAAAAPPPKQEPKLSVKASSEMSMDEFLAVFEQK